MKNVYFLFLFVALTCFTSHNMDAQNHVINPSTQANIEGLSIYPNPVNNQRTFINIASKLSLIKNIEVFDTPSYFKDITKYHQVIHETDLANNFQHYYKKDNNIYLFCSFFLYCVLRTTTPSSVKFSSL